MADRLAYNVKDAAALLGLSRATVERWTKAGLIPSRKIRNLRLIPADVLHDMLHGAPLPDVAHSRMPPLAARRLYAAERASLSERAAEGEPLPTQVPVKSST